MKQENPRSSFQLHSAESNEHKELKRLALVWAQAQGFRVAAAEVSLPNYRFRLDVAGYRSGRVRAVIEDEVRRSRRTVWKEAVGETVVFECKASRVDFQRDAHSLKETKERLKALHERKARVEEELKLFYPSIRNGDALFQEYETLDFERPGYERYQSILAEIGKISSRLYANTKFDKLVKWGAANLFYVVAEPEAVAIHEVPVCWGLLVRDHDALRLIKKPVLHKIEEPERISLLHRISLAATRAVNREHGITFDSIDAVWQRARTR